MCENCTVLDDYCRIDSDAAFRNSFESVCSGCCGDQTFYVVIFAVFGAALCFFLVCAVKKAPSGQISFSVPMAMQISRRRAGRGKVGP